MTANRIPILRVADNLLISIQIELTDRTITALQCDLLDELERRPAHGVLIDVSALEIVDSYLGRMLVDTAKQVAVMDARAVVTGIRPAVAITLVEMGVALETVDTALDLDGGISLLDNGGRGPDLSADIARQENEE